MDETLHAALDGWKEFYLITGAAAAALTGLQFVTQSLIASDGQRTFMDGDPEDSILAFGTPTVVHFALALLFSSVLTAPWPGHGGLRATLGVLGVAALVYSAIVLRRARRQQIYVPVAEDWIFHVVLPFAAYAAVLFTAVRLSSDAEGALFWVAGATLILLCVGIHNAWDTVTYLTLNALRRAAPAGEPAPPRRPPARHGRRRR